MSGADALTAFASRVRSLKQLGTLAARIAAPELQRVVRETASAGTTPDGKPWPLTKKGTAPLAHAADAVTARAIGTVLEMIVRGHYHLHHSGIARGRVLRQIIPAAITPRIADVLRRSAAKAFEQLMGGA